MAPHRSRHSMAAPEDYFRGVSPMCRRILDEMASVRESFGDAWNNLDYEEQCKILDQTIVDEATVRRYEHDGKTHQLDCVYFPKLKIETGQKIVSDEKLSARGYSCSWRDEHSAPFSWHTRSQMDLTLDTPPPTPTSSSAPVPNIPEPKKSIPKDASLNSIRTVNAFKTPAFLWHYDPTPDTKPPDPPDLVIGSTYNPINSSSDKLLTTSYNHLVIQNETRGIISWIRGAMNFFTGSCLPLHMCVDNKTQVHRSPFMHPDLRPAHVKAVKPTISQPNTVPPSKDSTLRVESSSVDTSMTACDVHSDAESIKNRSWSDKPSNRQSLYSGLASPIEESEVEDDSTIKESNNKDNCRQYSGSPDDSQPLIDDEAIPKTGFDFLDNW